MNIEYPKQTGEVRHMAGTKNRSAAMKFLGAIFSFADCLPVGMARL